MDTRAALFRATRSLLALIIGVVGLTALPASPASAAPTTCGGLVFQDYDADGERSEDYSYISPEYASVDDDGVAGLSVTVTDAQGDTFNSTTDTNGVWSVDLDTDDFPIRVDITGYPSTWTPGPVGPDSATLNQFIIDPADCTAPFDGTGPVGNASVSAPGSFCDNRPDFVTSCFLFGNFPDHDSQAAVVSLIDGSVDNLSTGADFAVDEYTTLATLGEVGTVYGVANRPQDGSTYVGSFVKRHTQLGPTGNPTTIYRIDASGASPWFTVDASAVDPHSGDTDGWLNDFASFDDVGRTGLGDVEISPDGNTLYTVDLGNRQLVSIPINADGSANTSGVSRTNISASALGVGGTCAADDVRPFGLGFTEDGGLLVGAVCSGESTVAAGDYPADIVNGPHLGDKGQLDAWVFSFDGSSFSNRIDVPLPTTSRGTQNGATTGPNAFRGDSDWRPWVTQPPFQADGIGWPAAGVAYAQPLLSDIEVDGDDLIIGFMDIWGHQNGSNAFVENYDGGNGGDPYQVEQPLSSGDTVRAVANGSGGYAFPTTGADFFYTGDFYGNSHQETTLGSAAQIPGRPYTVTNSFDPVEAAATWQSGGLEWFDNSGLGSLTAGQHVRGYRLYDGNDGSPVGTFEKAAGIGDLEATCGLAPIQVGNYLWHDANNNGIADPGETPLAGITVELVDASGNVVDSVVTNAAGEYLFDNLTHGAAYTIRVAASNSDAGAPLGTGGTYEGITDSTTTDAGSDDGIDSDATDVNGLPTISFTATETDHTMDIGLVEPAAELRLGNTVFIDTDANGSQNGSEPGVAGVEVQLWSVDAAGNPVAIIATDTTDGDGNYLFDGLAAGDYIVAIADTEQGAGEPLENYFSTTGNGAAPDPDDDVDLDDNGDPAPGFASISMPVTLSEGGEPTGEDREGGFIDADSNLSVDFGFVESLFRLGNLVWNDANNNGVADAGEAPIAGVEVQLWSTDAAGNPVAQIATTTTDADGHYLFPGLSAGDYVVAIASSQAASGAPLDGMTTSTGNDPASDPDDGLDNDDDGTAVAGFAAISDAVTLNSSAPTGETDGLTGGDDEADGFEDGASDLTVDFGFYGLLSLGDTVFADEDGNGSQNGTEPGIPGVEVQLWSVDAAGNPVAIIGTTTTDAAGNYSFTNLPAGDFIVAIADTQQAAGAPLESLASTTGNGTAPDPDDDVEADDNGDPAPGFASIAQPVTLSVGSEMGPMGTDNPTVDFGFVASLELGNLIWFDVNNDGIHNAGEAGAAGVIVELVGADGSVMASTVTDADGNYLFTDVAPGTYTVHIPASQFTAGGPLAGWHVSTGAGSSTDADDDTDENNDGAASGATITNGVSSSPVTLTGNNEPTDEVDESTTNADGDSNLTVDFGVYQVSLGNQVFFDLDNDGVRDEGEAPAPGVTLELLDEAGNPVLGPDGLPMTTITDANGEYSFDGLEDGTYVVLVSGSNFQTGGPLAGVVTSTGNDVGGNAPDPDDDVDGDDNGRFVVNGGAVSAPVTIGAGSEPGVTVNPTVDFGFTPSAGLGNRVFEDTNRDGVQDAGEPGVAGVTVVVTNVDNGDIVATVTTDTNGGYQVTGLPPGRYTVTFTDPQGRSWTSTDSGSDDAIDSDVSSTGTTGIVVLAAGEFDPTIDAGIVPTQSATATTATTTTTTSTTSTLAFTGSNLTSGMAAAALLLITIGGGFVLIARRREDEEAV